MEQGLMPKISIVTVCYNAYSEIESTIQSVIAQSYSNIEYIIIDGASTDCTQDVIFKYSKYLSYYHSQSDNGIYDAMNIAIAHATGDWVIFMNAGDSFFNRDVLKNIFINQSYHGVDIIYGSTNYLYPNYSIITRPYEISTICSQMPFCHQSSIVRKNVLERVKFDLKYRYLADFNFFRQLYASNYMYMEIPLVISNYSCLGGATHNNAIACFKEKAKILEYSKSSYMINYILINIRLIVSRLVPNLVLKKYRQKRY